MNGWPAQLLDDTQRLDWLRLWRSENVGPVLFYQLIDRFGSAATALEALPELARSGGRKKPVRLCTEAQAAEELERLQRLGARLLARGETGYPPLLAYSAAPPPLLALRGDLTAGQQPLVAIVGARNASVGGRTIARSTAAALAAEGYGVVSGLARGIDAAAHEGALAARGGQQQAAGTVAVLACGIDVPYPREHAGLMERITAEGGLLISEMPPGTGPKRELFPRRNRLVAGMSLGVVVVEAARRSGSLITARLAAEEGREVMAVPGSPLEPRAAGCNHLLREGAVLVRHADDVAQVLSREAAQLKMALREPPPRIPSGNAEVVDELPAPTAPPPAPHAAPTTASSAPAAATVQPPASLRQRLLALLSASPVHQDELLRVADADPADVLAALMELELAGEIMRTADGQLTRA